MPFSYRSGGSTTVPSNRTVTSFSTTHSNPSSFAFPCSAHQEEPTFKVLIVGGGIGGLMMGHCLERAGIDYVILERMQGLQVPKATIQLTSNTLCALEQLGLLDEVLSVAKPISRITMRKHNMSVVGKIDCLHVKERQGHYSYLVQRTEFCQILMSRMRSDRILWGRYVLEIVSGDGGVQCRCANGQVIQGDVLVGADGAYSAVRQNLYKNLKDKGLLPKHDMESLKFTQNAMVGMSRPLNVDRFPEAAAEFGEVHIVTGKDASPYTLWITPASGNRITWSVTGPLLTSNKSEQNFMVSQFGSEDVDKTCRLVESLEIPYGGTLGDLIAETPRECMTKILVEEKHYKTWYHGRTVLIGEACHKFVSFSGQGAEQAMLDAICLVNLFSKIQSPYPLASISEAFQIYHASRLPSVKAAVQSSGQVANLINGVGVGSEVLRKIVFNLPTWVQALSIDKVQVRPLLEFLPMIPDRGSKSVKAASIKSSS
ncbi:hypothetical protein EDD11_002853 [Mortierella claussenii]|nr:hypothetical protein EDD11_002853 [Mortierella claussenii]